MGSFGKDVSFYREGRAAAFPTVTPEAVPLLVGILRGALEGLRRCIEDPSEPSISWENPWVELRFPAKADGTAAALSAVTRGGDNPFPFVLPFQREAATGPWEGSAVLAVHALVADEDKHETYFPIVAGLAFAPDAPPPSAWGEEARADFWRSLLEDLPRAFQERLAAAASGHLELGPMAASGTSTAAAEPTVSPSVALVPAGATERAEETRRRSIMSPYPLPRSLAKDAQQIGLRRGLGRMFGSAAKIPDLDFRGETATLEAEALFWSVLEDHLDKALSGRTPPASWRKEALPTGETAILLYGLQVDEARGLWSSALRGMSATERGPGLEVADPLFESGNYMDQEGRKAVIITRLIFWPEDHLRTRDGEAVPPVRFRSQTSPGYLDLLDRQGPRPYFADGWLWLPRGEEREGWRIAGLPRLLFPEGRKALERLARRAKEEQEAELNRLLRNPSLFKDQDAKVVRELRSAIGQAEARIKELSLFDTRDLILCIFEAWYRQRDAWSRETVRLEDGTEVSTKPYRVIRLDPEDFRVRLDPRAATGANWRSHLFRRLEALATFERQTRDRKGRKLDVGDRLIERVLDGFQGVEEGSAPDQDSGLGLTRLLRKAGAVPSRDFFVTVSLDFMQRLVTWAVDEKGAIHWGLEAAKAAERAALAKAPETPKEARRGAEEVRRAAKAKPYFDGSPRLMSLSNLEDWPQADKDLAHALLQEVTRRGGKRRLSDGRDLIACAGSHGKGYKVQAWISKWAPHLLRSGPRGGVKAFALFTQSLRSLCLHGTLSVQVELRLSRRREETSPGESKWNEDALALLESYRDNPRAVYGLKLIPYLPEDLEDRLRKRLLEDGIEAVDEAEAGASVFAPPAKGVLAPADIRGARKRAGWGQAELAAKVGVSRVAISCWESGKKSIPKGRMGRLREVLAQYLEAEARGSWA